MRAILSVSDKTGLVELARGLTERGIELVSTGGTARALTSAGVPVVAVADVTGVPEMLEGRVKTLHPSIHAGILARRDRPGDLAALDAQGIRPVDLVVVNLYPFARAAADRATPFDALVEEIDIGGPTLVRAAAKNFRHVLVVVDPQDYASVLEALDAPDGPAPEFRFALARKAFAHTAEYDGTIAGTLADFEADPTAGGVLERRQHAVAPERLFVAGRKIGDLRYGENPHQRAAWYADGSDAGFGTARVLQGKELSYTNLLDLDAALRIVLEFTEPAAAVIKHTNPCGVATGVSCTEAYVRARDADSLSAFGGIVGLNRALDAETARAVTSTFVEAVVAPAVDDDARGILGAKGRMRVVVAECASLDSAGGMDLRSILGAFLVQERDRVVEGRGEWPGPPDLRVVTKRQPTKYEWQALRFAWRVCAHVKSNTVIFTSADRTLAIGAGQMSRVDAVKVATLKATGSLVGSVAASDAFFPFRDGLDAVAAAGATAVVQPGGSVRDAEVVAAADEHDLAMVFTARRHFRH
jgi:phosphoribosylaminoimidazolecarboxamide formyltransferase/IMP cyclohydrolase